MRPFRFRGCSSCDPRIILGVIASVNPIVSTIYIKPISLINTSFSSSSLPPPPFFVRKLFLLVITNSQLFPLIRIVYPFDYISRTFFRGNYPSTSLIILLSYSVTLIKIPFFLVPITVPLARLNHGSRKQNRNSTRRLMRLAPRLDHECPGRQTAT